MIALCDEQATFDESVIALCDEQATLNGSVIALSDEQATLDEHCVMRLQVVPITWSFMRRFYQITGIIVVNSSLFLHIYLLFESYR